MNTSSHRNSLVPEYEAVCGLNEALGFLAWCSSGWLEPGVCSGKSGYGGKPASLQSTSCCKLKSSCGEGLLLKLDALEDKLCCCCSFVKWNPAQQFMSALIINVYGWRGSVADSLPRSTHTALAVIFKSILFPAVYESSPFLLGRHESWRITVDDGSGVLQFNLLLS